MTIYILAGDTRQMMDQLPAGSVQCVVTSPPYFGLRDYGTGTWEGGDPACDHLRGALVSSKSTLRLDGRMHMGPYEGEKAIRTGMPFSKQCGKCGALRHDKQIGQEETPDDYVAEMVSVFRSVWRVLHSSGVAFLNLGDSYANAGKWGGSSGGKHADALHGQTGIGRRKVVTGARPKSLLQIPARVAIALQDDGWIVRSQIAWTKNNPMPDSVKDRPTSAWESIFILAKSERYFWDYEGAKEKAVMKPQRRGQIGGKGNPDRDHIDGGKPTSRAERSEPAQDGDGTRNMRNHWNINTVSFPGAHFATFPPEIPRRAITAATSEAGCCPTCRAPHRRIVEKGDPDLKHQRACGGDVAGEYDGQATKDYATAGAQNASDVKRRILAGMVEKITIGWEQTCDCPPAPPVPCLVLDPFGGSGTTVMVAKTLGRDGIMIDLKMDYARMAFERVTGSP